jgi:hypothetical protein
LLLAAQTTRNLSIFDPASPPAESIRNLSVLVFAINAFMGRFLKWRHARLCLQLPLLLLAGVIV